MNITSRHFTVDARLLRELGERLVGRPHIALAELIKNAYDADARVVEIAFDAERIVVSDDGHGMSEQDFVEKWMRIGSAHKEDTRTSPGLGRTMTGSKGVGRLAVQLLARDARVTSVALINPELDKGSAVSLAPQVDATIDWDTAIAAAELTAVTVEVRTGGSRSLFAAGSRHGTRVELSRLVSAWDAEGFQLLAQEIWMLQPPYELDAEDPDAFRVVFTTGFRDVYERFDEQMRAILDIWTARITGRLRTERRPGDDEAVVIDLPELLPSTAPEAETEGAAAGDRDGVSDADRDVQSASSALEPVPLPTAYLDVEVKLREGAQRIVTWRVPNCQIDELDFDILVFDLRHRQPRGLKVQLARTYLARFGGVGIHDAGFRLPYYGATQDWLDTERAHAARLSKSRLLPTELHVDRGLQDLPTARRLFGRVSISTSHEAQVRSTSQSGLEALRIQVSRDRLYENAAYQRLRVMVRASLDAYAMEQARTRLTKGKKGPLGRRSPSTTFSDIRAAIEYAKPSLPAATFSDLHRAVTQAVHEAEAIEETSRAHASLLGALATAGITALAYEHEISKQITSISDLADTLESLAGDLPSSKGATVGASVGDLRSWVRRARGIRQVLEPLMDEETRTSRARFPARSLASRVAEQVRVLSRGIPVSTDGLPSGLLLPEAAYPAWTAVFQNLYLNAFNALLDTDAPRVDVDGGGTDTDGWVRVQDTGLGVNLVDAERLWEPFERAAPVRDEVAGLELGGTGLGLTIVRMITDELGAKVAFTQPDQTHSTAVTVSWSAR